MNDDWSSLKFCNTWLREQSKSPNKGTSTLSLPTLEPLELELVLASIRQFEIHMKSGRVKIEILRGKISMSIVNSKEMST